MAAVTGPVRLWHDRDHDTVRLGLLERLCQVLDLHPVELFTAPTRVRQRRKLRPADHPADEQVLEAALTTLTAPSAAEQQPVGRAGLADALGWPLHREQMQAAAVRGWLANTLDGKELLLIVGSNADATALSREIRERLIEYSRVAPRPSPSWAPGPRR